MFNKQPVLSTDLTLEVKRESDHYFHRELCRKLSTKIDDFNIPPWFTNLNKCGSLMGIVECRDCDCSRVMEYRCSQKWCPYCNWKITEARKIKIATWASAIKNPKHLVLTQKNFEELTVGQLRTHYKNLTRIRRNKVFEHVKGGCVSVEITNLMQNEGWHLHSHWLVDASYVSMEELAIEWGKLCGQEFGICKFKDLANDENYLGEVCKYVCKPAAMVKWTPDMLLDFIEVSRGRRFFFSFGSLFHEGKKIREFLESVKELRETQCRCAKCDSSNVRLKIPSYLKSVHQRIAKKMCA